MDLSGVTRNVVLPVRVDPAGLAGPTPDEARGPKWRRSTRGYFVPSIVDATDTDQQAVEAAVALQEDWGAVTGWAGLRWEGASWFDGTPWGGGPRSPVTLAIGGNRWIREQRYFATSEERLAPGDLIVIDGLRLTTAVRSVCYEMRYAKDERDAAITLSMACYDDVVSIEEVAAYAATLNGWTGIPKCRGGIAWATENAWSPREVGMWHAWRLDAELPPPLFNMPVFDHAGTFLGTPDLIDPSAGVVGQYNGALHLAGARYAKDVATDDLFRRHGLECVTMVAGDLRDTSPFTARLHAAYDRAADIPVTRKLWTVERPAWWVDTTTVAARRALSEAQRARLLRYRAA